MDLVTFLAARLDEDEAAAKIAAVDNAWNQLRRMIPREPGTLNRCHRLMYACNPARVLREVGAARKILDEHKAVTRLADLTEKELGFLGWYREWVLKNLAAVYSDHPDYREEWKP